jgi:hypothetical protein
VTDEAGSSSSPVDRRSVHYVLAAVYPAAATLMRFALTPVLDERVPFLL